MTQQAIFIVRGFNKTEEDFLAWAERFEPIRTALERANLSYSLVYSTPDEDPTIPSEMIVPLQVVRAGQDNTVIPSWTVGLNIPIQQLLENASEGTIEHTTIVPISFETSIDNTNAEKLARAISEEKRILACRITPQWLTQGNSYPLGSEENVLKQWEYAQACVRTNTLADIITDDKRLQTLCMFGRNTLATYALSDFKKHGFFDKITDTLGGMEDWEYLLRLAQSSSIDEKTFEHAIFYTDVRIKEDEQDTETIQKQHEKLQREISALKKIIELKV